MVGARISQDKEYNQIEINLLMQTDGDTHLLNYKIA